jgi:hypothetical protein
MIAKVQTFFVNEVNCFHEKTSILDVRGYRRQKLINPIRITHMEARIAKKNVE